MTKEAEEFTTTDNKPRILVTRNGEIFVKPEDVIKSDKFKEQVKKIAKIRVTRGARSHR